MRFHTFPFGVPQPLRFHMPVNPSAGPLRDVHASRYPASASIRSGALRGFWPQTTCVPAKTFRSPIRICGPTPGTRLRKSIVCCACISKAVFVAQLVGPEPYQCAVNTMTLSEQSGSRQTGMRSTHIVSPGLVLRLVSSCVHCSGPAKPYLATSATPLRSELFAAHPSAVFTAAGVAHGHASARPSATTLGSLPTFAMSSACTAPTPHALSGCVRSVQLLVSANVAGNPGNEICPLPLLILKNATLKVVGAAACPTSGRPTKRSRDAPAATAEVDTRRAYTRMGRRTFL